MRPGEAADGGGSGRRGQWRARRFTMLVRWIGSTDPWYSTLRYLTSIAGFAAFAACSPPSAQEQPRDTGNIAARQELTALHDQDQADRSIGPSELARLAQREVDSLMAVVDRRDAARRQRVRELMARDIAQTADDYYHGAVVLQHGSATEDYLKAHEWSEAAIAMAPTHAAARYLFAASWDRYMLSQNKPQWYGTSVERGRDGNGVLSAIDTTQVTDSLRKTYTGWTLAERRAFIMEMNGRPRR